MALSTPYSTRFIAAELSNGTPPATVDYTVPAGRVAILSQMTMYPFATNTTGDVQVSIRVAGVTIAAMYDLHHVSTPTFAVPDIRSGQHIVLNPGDVLRMQAISGYHCWVTAHGYLLTSP